ncbi:MAG: UbiA family prenyltransferase [Planctomycetota bacterium]|nr:UbiA family prenyltransferase [Planctomycetota bacterium]MDP6837915.1 UbiA family prenyltransferase [Planctomycetota bacterium]MDP6956249.1 UbiA family prenyltransferase [Planctomycetota bacterium]
MSPHALARLLRVSLLPTALADALAGLVLGAGGWPAGPVAWLVLPASVAFLHGGLVLNDWADRERDRLSRPERPLPAGHISPRTALAIAVGLLGAGLLCLGLLSLGLPSSATTNYSLLAGLLLVASILYYSLGPRGPWRGPLLLGACRGLNLTLALLAAWQSADWQQAGAEAFVWLPLPLCYAAHVFFLSRLGRLEDGEDPRPVGRRPTVFLGSAGLCLMLAALMPLLWSGQVTDASSLAVAFVPAPLLGLYGLGRLLRASRLGPPWTRELLQSAMGRALGGLTIFSTVVLLNVLPSLAADQYLPVLLLAALVLAGLPLSQRLARSAPPS